MKSSSLLSELEKAAEGLGVRVSYEVLASSVGSGGLCRVKGTYRVIVDKRASTDERAATLAAGLAKLGWEHLELTAPARLLIQHFALRQAS